MSVAAIILAAGESTRMGSTKQVLPWGGTTLLAWQVRQMRAAGADEVVVVLGHAAREIAGALASEECRVVVNEAYKEGRATSLKCGAQAVSDGVEAVLILSVDQPRPAWLARRLIDYWRREGGAIVSPRFQHGYGHPILLDGALLPELRAVDDRTLGLRAVIDRHVEDARSVPIANQAVDVDLNTPDAYAAALASFERGEWQAENGSAKG